MRWLTVLALLWLVASGSAPAFATTEVKPSANAGDEAVWHWYSECAKPVTMKVEIVQRGALVFATTFPMCKLRRDQATDEKFQRHITFPLSDERLRLFGQPAKTAFEGDFWQAGMESDGLMLGLSFSTPDLVAYNGLVFADPSRAVEQKVAPGVLVRLSPIAQ
jgi:hypothetical protein